MKTERFLQNWSRHFGETISWLVSSILSLFCACATIVAGLCEQFEWHQQHAVVYHPYHLMVSLGVLAFGLGMFTWIYWLTECPIRNPFTRDPDSELEWSL